MGVSMSGAIVSRFPAVRLVLGVCAFGVSLYYSWLFIAAGAAGAALITAAVFVVVTEVSKVVFVTDVEYYLAVGQEEKAAGAALLVLVLFLLSISATAFHIITNASGAESAALQSSAKYKNLQTAIDDAEQAIQSARVALAACPSGHSSKCVQPRMADINRLTGDKAALLQQQSAIQPSAGGFWDKLAEITGYTAAGLQTSFAFLRGILLEVLGLLLIAQGAAARRVHQGGQSVVVILERLAVALEHQARLQASPALPAPVEEQTTSAQHSKTCQQCGVGFDARTTWQKYCLDCRAERAAPHVGKKRKS